MEKKGRWYERIVAACEDVSVLTPRSLFRQFFLTFHTQYRAGSTIDVEVDIASGLAPKSVAEGREGRRPLDLPLLVLYSAHLGHRFAVDEIWGSLSTPEKIKCYSGRR